MFLGEVAPCSRELSPHAQDRSRPDRHSQGGSGSAARIHCKAMRRDELIARLKAAEPEIRAGGAAALDLFGSAARDEARADGDIDLFIDPEPARRFGFNAFMGRDELLPERRGAKIDDATRERLHRRLRPEIEKTAIKIFG
jgi:predicted nucleotidyltransferase